MGLDQRQQIDDTGTERLERFTQIGKGLRQFPDNPFLEYLIVNQYGSSEPAPVDQAFRKLAARIIAAHIQELVVQKGFGILLNVTRPLKRILKSFNMIKIPFNSMAF